MLLCYTMREECKEYFLALQGAVSDLLADIFVKFPQPVAAGVFYVHMTAPDELYRNLRRA